MNRKRDENLGRLLDNEVREFFFENKDNNEFDYSSFASKGPATYAIDFFESSKNPITRGKHQTNMERNLKAAKRILHNFKADQYKLGRIMDNITDILSRPSINYKFHNGRKFEKVYSTSDSKEEMTKVLVTFKTDSEMENKSHIKEQNEHFSNDYGAESLAEQGCMTIKEEYN